MKILLTGGNSAVALKLLKAFTSYQVVLADYGDVPSFASKDYKFISLGIKNEDVLAHTLLNYCLDEGVDTLLPIHHFEIEALAKSKVLFGEFNIELLLPEATDLQRYLKFGHSSKIENWVVFSSGEVIFSTDMDKNLIDRGKNENLNGVYQAIGSELYLLTI